MTYLKDLSKTIFLGTFFLLICACADSEVAMRLSNSFDSPIGESSSANSKGNMSKELVADVSSSKSPPQKKITTIIKPEIENTDDKISTRKKKPIRTAKNQKVVLIHNPIVLLLDFLKPTLQHQQNHSQES